MSAMKKLLIIIALALIAGLVVIGIRSDEPVITRSLDTPPGPWFEVQVTKPRSARPIFGILPAALEAKMTGHGDLGFDSARGGVKIGSVGENYLELSADGWDLVIETDREGNVSPATHLTFPIELANRQLTLRCEPADRPSGYLFSSTREGTDNFDGRFSVKLAVCTNVATGDTLDWPPRPLTVRGSFEGLPHHEGAGSWNGEVKVHGALRAIHHQGQTGVQVTLDEILPNPDVYALGAVADLSGEITILGGNAYLSYPDGEEATRTEMLTETNAGATLLVAADVPVWRAVVTEHEIRFEDLGEAIGKLAAAAGMSLDTRIPFLLEGEFEDLQWHVIDGARLPEGNTSHSDHMNAAVKTSRARTSARLIGFYSQSDQGVFTHMDSTTHVHCVLGDPLASGHVDHVVIPAGTTLKFPE